MLGLVMNLNSTLKSCKYNINHMCQSCLCGCMYCMYACTDFVCFYYSKVKQQGNMLCEIVKPVFRKMWKTSAWRPQLKLFLRSELYPVIRSGIILQEPIKCDIAFSG